MLIDLGAKTDLRTPENESLLQIAFTNNHRETMKELLRLIITKEKYVKDSIKEREMFYDEMFLRDDKKDKPLCPNIFLKSSMLIAYEMQLSLVYNIPRLLLKSE